MKTNQPVLSTGLLREAMSGSARRSRLEEAEAAARFNAEKSRIETEFRKQFKIEDLKAKAREAERAYDKAQTDLEEANEKMNDAMSERIAKLQDKKADSLAHIGAKNAEREFKLLGLSLPPEARKILELDKIEVKPETAKLLSDGRN
jgi:DNA anti-recombination protein RmuC